ncbi:MAG: glycosyltransferase family 1 protein [Chitinophagaceae bacterium]|nr:MAG: glycosyltransferase family 1 protein [Chitinophagaceae bacterium]
MNIVIYIDGPATEDVFPPSFFAGELLPGLLEGLKGHTVSILAEGSDLAGNPHLAPAYRHGLTTADEPGAPGGPDAGHLLFPGLSVISLPQRSALAAAWWNMAGLPARIRALKADRFLSVNAIHQVKGVSCFAWFDGEARLTEKSAHRAARGLKGLFTASPSVVRKPAIAAALADVPLVVAQRPARAAYVPLDFHAKEATRLVHTGGRNYFLYMGPLDGSLMELVKAFSVFKKRQKSDWRLVLAGAPAGTDVKFLSSLDHYLYKNDLVVMRNVKPAVLPSLVGAAYAVLFPPQGQPSLVPEVCATGVPAIVPDQPQFHGTADEAMVFYDASRQVDLAENMMTIYKNESLRSAKCDAGLRMAATASWQDLAGVVISALLK